MKITETKLLIAQQKSVIKELRKQIEVAAKAQKSTVADLRSLEHISAVARTKTDERYKQCQFDLEILQRRYGHLMQLIYSWLEDDIKPELHEVFDDQIDETIQHPVMRVSISKDAAQDMSYSKAQSIRKALDDINEFVEENNLIIDGGEFDADDN
tara:strand:- start:1080 stop:1544 length:465 start_codon:yes stop_codon:yes gene_type:complete